MRKIWNSRFTFPLSASNSTSDHTLGHAQIKRKLQMGLYYHYYFPPLYFIIPSTHLMNTWTTLTYNSPLPESQYSYKLLLYLVAHIAPNLNTRHLRPTPLAFHFISTLINGNWKQQERTKQQSKLLFYLPVIIMKYMYSLHCTDYAATWGLISYVWTWHILIEKNSSMYM